MLPTRGRSLEASDPGRLVAEGWSQTRGILRWLLCLIIRLIIQTIRRDPSGFDQIDDPVQREQARSVGADQIDAEHQPTDLAVGGSNPSRRTHFRMSKPYEEG
jgi:hypothetical protein